MDRGETGVAKARSAGRHLRRMGQRDERRRTGRNEPNSGRAELKYVSGDAPGFRRRRQGKDFVYLTAAGRPVTDATVLDRIRRLAIPPAYEDVWICSSPNGHLQATGRDARGRKQYRYHAQWRLARDGAKFERMAAFGAALPRLRRRIRRDLAAPGMTREKIIAAVVSLLDATLVRVGNDEYARSNGSFGLTTLRNRHVRFAAGGALRLAFRGKRGVAHEIAIGNRRLAAIVRHCHQLPGQRLFQFIDGSGLTRPVNSDQVNEYLREAMGADFTAKDFRTWGATARCAELLGRTPLPERRSERALKACETEVVRRVASELRNTPAVCRKSYINPVAFHCWRSGHLHTVVAAVASGNGRRSERITLAMLRSVRLRLQAGKRSPVWETTSGSSRG